MKKKLTAQKLTAEQKRKDEELAKKLRKQAVQRHNSREARKTKREVLKEDKPVAVVTQL